MHIQVHPAETLLRGDERYNPRFTAFEIRPLDGAHRITGEMRPDSPEGVAARPALPKIPFRYIVPASAGQADYHRVNVETWRRLRSGKSLWDLDFTQHPFPS